jgi:predicted phage tail protein
VVMQNFYEKKMPISAIMKTPEYQALDGDQKAKFVNGAESYFHTQEARASARASRAAAEENRAYTALARTERVKELNGRAATLAYLTNPEAVANMTPNGIQALALEIGYDNAQHILNFQKTLTKTPGGLAAAKMDTQSFKTIISEYGYNPALLTSRSTSLTSKEVQQQAEMGNILLEVNQRIQAKATADKKPPTLEEKEHNRPGAMH